jgi:hypothetical protein
LRIRVRDAVLAQRRSKKDEQTSQRSLSLRTWLIGTGLGLAALVAFTFNIFPNRGTVAVDSDLPEVSAFEDALEVEDFDFALSQLEEELNSFDALLVDAGDEDNWMDDSTGL